MGLIVIIIVIVVLVIIVKLSTPEEVKRVRKAAKILKKAKENYRLQSSCWSAGFLSTDAAVRGARICITTAEKVHEDEVNKVSDSTRDVSAIFKEEYLKQCKENFGEEHGLDVIPFL